jgi:argininosuccinate synthase
LNDIGSKNGIGRLDIVESRSTGMKSRGCYETPGGSILLKARRAIESICMDGDSIKTKDELISKYSSLIYDVCGGHLKDLLYKVLSIIFQKIFKDK